MRLFKLAATALLAATAGLALVTATHESALADTGVEATDKCEISTEEGRINVLLLLDASRSLVRTDAGNARRDGLEAAVQNLANLARSSPEVAIFVAVDTFSANYNRQHGWQDAAGAPQALSGRYDSITALPGAVTRASTDYREAMRGASGRFRDAPTSGCNLLLWFTDGEHATEGTSADVSQREWEQLRSLCGSDEMDYLSERSVWSVGVLLSSGDSPVNSGPLEQLFGVGRSPCRYALDGDIRSDVGASSLRDALDELISEIVYEVETEAETEDDLPGEPDDLPPDDDYSVCSGGDGTAERPCEYSLSLNAGVDSFRVFVDMTFLGRGIGNPGSVNILLRSPSGKQSEPIVSTVLSDEPSTSQYQPVRPFWFLSRRPYDSRWEIIGHQAAEQIAADADWEWAGEWTLLFWGDTPPAAEDAAKVAAAFRAVTFDAPSASLSLSNEGKLIGFIENFPSEYQSVELRLKLTDAADSSVYPTRPYLTCELAVCDPVPVSDGEHRFEVPRLLDEILWWDSEQAGGDGLKLVEAVAENGPVSAVADLQQVFLYGGTSGYGRDGESGQPLGWSRDIGEIELDNLGALMAGQREWEVLSDWVNSGAQEALPFGLRLLPAPYDIEGDRVVFRVELRPGYFPGVITLEEVRPQITTGTASVPSYDQGWSCEIPGVNGQPGGEPTTCGAIRVDLGLSDDAEVTVQMDFRIAPVEGLEEIARSPELTVPSEQDWNSLWGGIQQAAAPREQSVESTPFLVDLPTPVDKFREFLPMLLLLLALAALLRLVVAWKLRPWSPLRSPEYVDKPYRDAEASIDGYEPLTDERKLCMDLTGSSVEGQMSSVVLFSRWKPLLLGRPPQVAARSSNGQCLGPQGSYATRKGNQIGIIGEGLHDGWVLETRADESRLIVWDFESDDEMATRLAEVEDTAAALIEKAHSNEAIESDPESGDGPDASEQESPAPTNNDPFAERDPFQ